MGTKTLKRYTKLTLVLAAAVLLFHLGRHRPLVRPRFSSDILSGIYKCARSTFPFGELDRTSGSTSFSASVSSLSARHISRDMLLTGSPPTQGALHTRNHTLALHRTQLALFRRRFRWDVGGRLVRQSYLA